MAKSSIHSIIRGQWAISLAAAQSWYPAIAHWIESGRFHLPATSQLAQTAQPQSIVSFISANGQRITGTPDEPAEIKPNTVAVIDIVGELIKYGDMCTYGADEISAHISQTLSMDNVTGAVLLLDTPGGQVSAIPPITQAIAQSGKPVVALADTCASAGYYIAAQCSHIMAANTLSAAFGSIGVVVSFADFSKHYQEKGITFHEVYADQSTHKNAAFAQALQGNYEALKKEMLNPLAQNFIEHVKNQRGAKLNTKEEGILAGKMFFAQDALKHGLIDSIGTLADAVQKVRTLSTVSQFMSN